MSVDHCGLERRDAERFEFKTPLLYKICDRKSVSGILRGSTANISQTGVLCNFNDRLDIDNILWLVFDQKTLGFWKEVEHRMFIHQKGIFGKVVRVEDKEDGSFDIGIRFLARKDKDVEYLGLLWY